MKYQKRAITTIKINYFTDVKDSSDINDKRRETMSFQENKNIIITVCAIIFISLIFYSEINSQDEIISNLESNIQELEDRIQEIEYTVDETKELAKENDYRISEIEDKLNY